MDLILLISDRNFRTVVICCRLQYNSAEENAENSMSLFCGWYKKLVIRATDQNSLEALKFHMFFSSITRELRRQRIQIHEVEVKKAKLKTC